MIHTKANYTCQVLSLVEKFASFHGQEPGYYGNQLVITTLGFGLGGLAIAGGITVAKVAKSLLCSKKKQQYEALEPRVEPRSYMSFSTGSKIANVISIASFAVGFLDSVGLLPPFRPSTQFQIDAISSAVEFCIDNCTYLVNSTNI